METGYSVKPKRRSLSLRPDYLKITKDELKKELKLRGLRPATRRVDMIRKLEKWESEQRNRVEDRRGSDSVGETSVDIFYGGSGDRLYKMSLDTSRNRQSKANGHTNSYYSPQETASKGLNLHTERRGLVIWRRPLITIRYFVCEVIALLGDLIVKLYHNKGKVLLALHVLALCVTAYYLDGGHQQYIKPMEKRLLWCIYWVGLGVLSSVGLGTGLHTFLLYLGPHIAAVTLAASECRTLDFPEPPYPDEIVCPEVENHGPVPGILAIMSKVRLEAFMWGAGTALGELPPYFMAKAARLSGELDDDDLEVLEEMKLIEASSPNQLSFLDRAKLAVENLIQKVGFLGILACASIPNPLFDVAGFMCGHFLVPFRTFFGATLIGKAVVKMHIQKMFVIFAFDESHVQMLLNLIKTIPGVGKYVEAPFEEFLQKQRAKLHRSGEVTKDRGSMLSWIFEKFVLLMVLYFLVSIVNSMAQNYHKRINKKQQAKKAND